MYVCSEVSSYVDSYTDLEVYDLCEAGFCGLCLDAYIRDQRKAWLFLIH